MPTLLPARAWPRATPRPFCTSRRASTGARRSSLLRHREFLRGDTRARVGNADVAESLEELPTEARAFWATRFTTGDDGTRTRRAVRSGGVLLGHVRDARRRGPLAAAHLDPSLARADNVAASWLRAISAREEVGFAR